jgi:hypothetical protein
VGDERVEKRSNRIEAEPEPGRLCGKIDEIFISNFPSRFGFLCWAWCVRLALKVLASRNKVCFKWKSVAIVTKVGRGHNFSVILQLAWLDKQKKEHREQHV